MSYVAEHNEIRTRFNTVWNNTLPVAWPNVEYTPTVGTPWTRITIFDNPSAQVDIGSPLKTYRNTGLIIVQIFCELNKGNGTALGYADTVAGIFRNWCGSTVRCRAPHVEDIGNDGHGWYQVNVSIPFVRDELI